MQVSEIIRSFGGLTRLSTLLGVPTSTVHSWQSINYIPAWRQPKILELAATQGIALSTADFPDKSKAAA
jgi:hypothetical protein